MRPATAKALGLRRRAALAAPTPAAPVNTSLPVISGTPEIGETLTISNGSWSGHPSPTFTYQWRRDTVDISGETASTYTLAAADNETAVDCVVTATNSEGSASATAASVAVTYAAPTFSSQPTFGAGSYTVGDTASFSEGTAGPNATLTIEAFTLEGVDKSGELVGTDWDTTGESAGTISLQVRATNSGGFVLSNAVTVELAAAAATVSDQTALFGADTFASAGGWQPKDSNGAFVALTGVTPQGTPARTWSVASGLLIANGTPGVDDGELFTVTYAGGSITVTISTEANALTVHPSGGQTELQAALNAFNVGKKIRMRGDQWAAIDFLRSSALSFVVTPALVSFGDYSTYDLSAIADADMAVIEPVEGDTVYIRNLDLGENINGLRYRDLIINPVNGTHTYGVKNTSTAERKWIHGHNIRVIGENYTLSDTPSGITNGINGGSGACLTDCHVENCGTGIAVYHDSYVRRPVLVNIPGDRIMFKGSSTESAPFTNMVVVEPLIISCGKNSTSQHSDALQIDGSGFTAAVAASNVWIIGASQVPGNMPISATTGVERQIGQGFLANNFEAQDTFDDCAFAFCINVGDELQASAGDGDKIDTLNNMNFFANYPNTASFTRNTPSFTALGLRGVANVGHMTSGDANNVSVSDNSPASYESMIADYAGLKVATTRAAVRVAVAAETGGVLDGYPAHKIKPGWHTDYYDPDTLILDHPMRETGWAPAAANSGDTLTVSGASATGVAVMTDAGTMTLTTALDVVIEADVPANEWRVLTNGQKVTVTSSGNATLTAGKNTATITGTAVGTATYITANTVVSPATATHTYTGAITTAGDHYIGVLRRYNASGRTITVTAAGVSATAVGTGATAVTGSNEDYVQFYKVTTAGSGDIVVTHSATPVVSSIFGWLVTGYTDTGVVSANASDPGGGSDTEITATLTSAPANSLVLVAAERNGGGTTDATFSAGIATRDQSIAIGSQSEGIAGHDFQGGTTADRTVTVAWGLNPSSAVMQAIALPPSP